MRSFSQKLAEWQGDGMDTLRNRIKSPDDVKMVMSKLQEMADSKGEVRTVDGKVTERTMREYIGKLRRHYVLLENGIYTAE